MRFTAINTCQAATIILLITITISCFKSAPAITPINKGGLDASEQRTSVANRLAAQPSIVERKLTVLELESLADRMGMTDDNSGYNLKVGTHGTGLRPPTAEEFERLSENMYLVEQIQASGFSQQPSQVDLSSTPWFPPIGNQDGEGSCVAWAVGYYVKTFQEAKEHGWDLSNATWDGGYYGHPTTAYQDRIFSPDFIYHLINGGVDGGSSFYMAMNLISSVGACSWAKMPYNPSDHTSWPSEEAWREAPLYRGNSSGYEYLSLDSDEDLASLKNLLASEQLAVIAVDAYKYSQFTSSDVWTLDNYVSPCENHANTIVGYDDNLTYTEQGQTRHGAFKIANSWGVGGWENVNDGCYWISYEAMKQRVEYCMFYRDLVGYEPKLVASFKIDHLKRAECYITVGIGNKSFPIKTRSFSAFISGGNQPFCSNSIFFDITEFTSAVPSVYNQLFFLKVSDSGSATTGAIIEFAVEDVHSQDTPLSTVNNQAVYASLTLSPCVHMRVFPEQIDLGTDNVVGKNFTVALAVENVSSLYAFYIKFSWDTAYLECLSHTVTVPVDDNPVPISPSPYAGILHSPFLTMKDELNETSGCLQIACNSTSPAPVFNGNGTVALLTFQVRKQSTTEVDVKLSYLQTELTDYCKALIMHVAEDGHVTIPRSPPHTTPPVISVLSPENKTYSVNNLPLIFTVDEATSCLEYCLDRQSNVTVDGNVTLACLSDGAHVLKIYANDTFGNMGCSEDVWFTVDTSVPDVKLVTPQNETYAQRSVPLIFTVDESASSMWCVLDGQINIQIEENTTLWNLLDGYHQVVVYVNDTAGNVGASDYACFVVDTSPPNIAGVSQFPSVDSVPPESEVTVNATVIDNLSGIRKVLLNCTGGNGTWVTVEMHPLDGYVWSACIPFLANCKNVTYVIVAEDNVNNTAATQEMGYVYQYFVVSETQLLPMLLLSTIAATLLILIFMRKRFNKH